jgi:hypothetical protein
VFENSNPGTQLGGWRNSQATGTISPSPDQIDEIPSTNINVLISKPMNDTHVKTPTKKPKKIVSKIET